jgi:hypothetical protein
MKSVVFLNFVLYLSKLCRLVWRTWQHNVNTVDSCVVIWTLQQPRDNSAFNKCSKNTPSLPIDYSGYILVLRDWQDVTVNVNTVTEETLSVCCHSYSDTIHRSVLRNSQKNQGSLMFLWIPFYLQAVHIHSANGVKLLEAWRGVLKVTLRLTVSQSYVLVSSPNLGHLTRDFFFSKLLSCLFRAPSLTRGRVCHMSVFVIEV